MEYPTHKKDGQAKGRTKDRDDKVFRDSWYKESLSLINTGDTAIKKRAADIPEDKWKPCLGILNLNMNGEELWSYGDTGTCQSFVSKTSLADFPSDKVSVEIYRDSLIVLSTVRETIRLVSIDHSSVMEILRDVVPDIDLSNAELRLLLQILSGNSLKEAAEKDNVSYETKRSQFKSLSLRTGFRTQSEVIRNSLLALNAHVLDSVGSTHIDEAQEAAKETNDEQAFLNLYYPDIFRFHKISIAAGRVLRVAETGPLSGTPIVFAHSQTLPHPNQLHCEWLKEQNVRLIIPLRDGFLGGRQSAKSTSQHLESGAVDLADAIEFFCGGKAKIVAQSTGVAYAINLAKSRPELISELMLCASAYLGKYDNRLIDGVVKGFMNLAARSNLLLEQIYDRYLGKMSTKDGLRDVLHSAYKNSPNDMEIFNSILSSSLGHSWMSESYRLSRWSVINDVLLGSHNVWADTGNISVPVLFLHGATDPVNAAVDANQIQKRFANSRFVQLPDEGQSLFLNRFEDIITKSSSDWQGIDSQV